MGKSTQKFSIYPTLPKTAKENRTKSGKKKPLTKLQAQALKRVPFCIDTVQRRAIPFFRTNRLGYLLTLCNEITGDFVRVDFVPSELKYIKITSSKGMEMYMQEPKTVREFFIKLLNQRFL